MSSQKFDQQPKNPLASERDLDKLSRMALLAFAAYGLFLLLALVAHFLQPDRSALQQDTSAYLSGSYGGLMTSAYIALGAGTFGLATGLYYFRLPRSSFALLLLAFFGFTMVLVGIFPTGPQLSSGGTHSLAHMVGWVAGLSGILLFTSAARDDPEWRSYYRPAAFLSLGAAALFLVWIVPLSAAGLAGLGQRLFMAAFFGWLVFSTWMMRKKAQPAGGQGR